MVHVSEVTLYDFQEVLTPTSVKSIQVIYIALLLGIFAFIGVVVFMSMVPSDVDAQPDPSLIRLLSYIHLAFGLIVYTLSKRIYHSTIGSRRIMDQAISGPSGQGTSVSPAEIFFQSIRAACVIRLALMEGVAFFGLVICLLASQAGVLQIYPVYWLNLLSSLIFIGYVFGTLPTKERLVSILREKQGGTL